MTVKRFLSLLGLICLSAPALACSSDERITLSQSLAERGKTFAAINELKDGLGNCYHPRLKLELGALYLQLGDLESALSWWQSALTEDELPAKVAAAVKLRIIQAKLSPPSSDRAHMLLGAGVRYQSDSGVSHDFSIVTAGQHRGRSTDAWGYPLTPGLYGKFSGTNRYYWQNDTSLSSLLVTAGVMAEAAPASLSMGATLQNQSDSLSVGAVSELSVRFAILTLTTALQGSTQRPQFKITESARVNSGDWTASLSLEAQYDSQQWQFDQLTTKFRLNNRWKPTLQAEYDAPTAELSGYAQVTWPITPQIGLQSQTGATLSTSTLWYTKLTLNWQPF
ncbi:lipopolysaccharide assembly protein LapB [Reinekea sp. G2M2-21]|uniref:tetratricopeptide repeat protein n=1 Tax=Reinekea sp. G2M2-21 TaxID=2788942 RepID=UPI0018ABB329|nr:hypothetical protein [Reinekea sp. G2M2-21]